MKTAISIPDEVFEAAEQAAKSLGVSRSELYATAVREFVARYCREAVTEKLNQVYADDESVSRLDERLQSLQMVSLEKEDWE
jgi:metal-responsive CopG/Arc/MetJ family transcriptional regulator